MKDNYVEKERTGVYQVLIKNLDSGQKEVYIYVTARNLVDRIARHKNVLCDNKMKENLI